MRVLTLIIVGGILAGWGPALQPVAAGPTRIETEGTLVSIPAGKGRRVGVKNALGTVWLATPSANGSSLARSVFHRLRQLPANSYVKISGVVLSTDPLKIGPEEIKSGTGSEVVTLDVAKDGKSATTEVLTAQGTAQRTVRVHPVSSIPNNGPSRDQPIKRQLLTLVKGRRVQVKGFAFKDNAKAPTDVFLDTVMATVPTDSKLVSYADRKTGARKVLQDLPAGAQVWISHVEGDYARVRYEVRTSERSTASHGGWVKLSHLRIGEPAPLEPQTKLQGDSKGLKDSLGELSNWR